MQRAAALIGITVFTLLTLAWVGSALRTLHAAGSGLEVVHASVNAIPVTVFRAAAPATPGDSTAPTTALPVVVIAHGFAGSQQLMQAFATTAARNGMIAVTFDFPGHGRHPQPLPGRLQDHDALLAALLGALEQVVAFARGLPGADGRVALLGHSMASDLVVRQAQADPAIVATVGISLVYGGARSVAPPNLLSVYGSLEPALVQSFGRRLVAGPGGQRELLSDGAAPAPESTGEATTDAAIAGVVPGRTYGRFDDGSARRFVLASGAEHIGVLYHATSQRESLDWLRQAFAIDPAPAASAAPFVDTRGLAISGLLAGAVMLGWPLSLLLGRLSGRLSGRLPGAHHGRHPGMHGRSRHGRRGLQPGATPVARRDWLWVSAGPALATPLVLRLVPTQFLPILLGDYLLLHFALYGLLTVAGIAWLARHRRIDLPAPRLPSPGAAAAAFAVVAWATLAIGIPVDRYVFNLWPADGRGPLIAAMLAGTLVWALADEWLARHPQAPRMAYPMTKALFIGSLVLAVALDLKRLFFLIIIIPAILVMFMAYGLLSRWSFRATGSPWPGALATACAFAWGIAVTFPAISR
jgi:dienelactone hydrolase